MFVVMEGDILEIGFGMGIRQTTFNKTIQIFTYYY